MQDNWLFHLAKDSDKIKGFKMYKGIDLYLTDGTKLTFPEDEISNEHLSTAQLLYTFEYTFLPKLDLDKLTTDYNKEEATKANNDENRIN